MATLLRFQTSISCCPNLFRKTWVLLLSRRYLLVTLKSSFVRLYDKSKPWSLTHYPNAFLLFLVKRGHFRTNLKKRYFILLNEKIVYYGTNPIKGAAFVLAVLHRVTCRTIPFHAAGPTSSKPSASVAYAETENDRNPLGEFILSVSTEVRVKEEVSLDFWVFKVKSFRLPLMQRQNSWRWRSLNSWLWRSVKVKSVLLTFDAAWKEL